MKFVDLVMAENTNKGGWHRNYDSGSDDHGRLAALSSAEARSEVVHFANLSNAGEDCMIEESSMSYRHSLLWAFTITLGSHLDHTWNSITCITRGSKHWIQISLNLLPCASSDSFSVYIPTPGEELLALLMSGVRRSLQRHAEHQQWRADHGHKDAPNFKYESVLRNHAVLMLSKLGRSNGNYMQVSAG